MTEEMKQAEIEVEDEMMCTAEMTFEGLCCAPWATGLDYSQSVSLGLKSEQVTETSASLAELTTGETYKLCTEQSAGEELATMAARLPVTCFEDIFTEADLVGGQVGNETLGAGEAILRTRLGFFLSQGIPMDVIPKCSENVAICPDGSAPAIVQDSWIQEMSDASLLQKRTKRGSGRSASSPRAGMPPNSAGKDALSRTVQLAAETRDAIQLVKTVKDESEAAFEEGWIDGSAPASAGQGVLSLRQKRKRRAGRRGGGGQPVTTGEFTMSSNRGGNS